MFNLVKLIYAGPSPVYEMPLWFTMFKTPSFLNLILLFLYQPSTTPLLLHVQCKYSSILRPPSIFKTGRISGRARLKI